MPKLLLLTFVVAVALTAASPTSASGYIRYGVQDDAWLLNGPGSLEERVAKLDALGVDIVRTRFAGTRCARQKPLNGRSHLDPAYGWENTDAVLHELRAHGIAPLVTLLGAPLGQRRPLLQLGAALGSTPSASFAYATQKRYPFVRDWLIWNEPNQRRWLRPTSASVYVSRLLNPAYTAIVKLAGRPASPAGLRRRAARPAVSPPVRWIRGMDAARARLDAYAHRTR